MRLAALNIKVGLPACFSCEDTRASKWIFSQSKGEDKIKLLENFLNIKLLNAKVNITEWLVSQATQGTKLNKLNHPINDDCLMTHILASLPHEYSSVVDHTKIDWRTNTLTLMELKKRLKEKHMQLQKEKGRGEDEMALSVSQNTRKNQNKGSGPWKTTIFKG